MAVIARLLIAQQAFIEELQSQIITLKNGGVIKSCNYDQGVSGFVIKVNGDAEFNDMTVRNSAIFDSQIFADPLYLSKETPIPITKTFSPGAAASQISNEIGNYKAVNGQYNNIAIKGISVNTQTTNIPGDQYVIFWNITRTRVYAVYENGGEVLLADQASEAKTWIEVSVIWDYYGNPQFLYNPKSYSNTTHTLTLQNFLWFNFIMSGGTMRLLNIPDSQPAQEGTVWRNGHSLMIV